MTGLFVGVTSWNSETFLGLSLESIRKTIAEVDAHVVVWDNSSQDRSVEVARSHGADVVVRPASQADALNGLLALADREWVLLMHADVVMLDSRWFPLYREVALREEATLIAPEDVGCGPYTRPFGCGMPESSFMFFNLDRARKARIIRWRRWRGIPLPHRELALGGPHVTHSVPRSLAEAGLTWVAVDVQPSDRLAERRYGPYCDARLVVWAEELSFLRYGLGNFYSINGAVTHYHNWYDRLPNVAQDSATGRHRTFPPEFIRDYTNAFIRDYQSGNLVIPPARKRDREPTAL